MTLEVANDVSAAMREFLVWVAFRDRTYADTMEAWGSHCPRFTLWEDALDQGSDRGRSLACRTAVGCG